MRIATLDGWRGIAILLVLADHFLTQGSNWHIGQHGVNMFFVLSGYLITSRLLDERKRTGKISLKRFYVRRFFRLMPTAWLYLAMLGFAGVLQVKEAMSCLLFFRHFSNFGNSSPTLHFWSLSVEEDFYLVWPAALILFGEWGAIVIGAGLVFLTGSGIAAGTPLLWVAQRMEIPPLMAGCLTAFLPDSAILPRRRVLLAVSLIMLAACVYIYHQQYLPLSELWLIAFAIWSTAGESKIATKVLGNRALAGLGVISYALYVWHFPFSIYGRPAGWPIWVLIPCSILLAIAFHRVIEKPCIEYGARLLSRRSAVKMEAPA